MINKKNIMKYQLDECVETMTIVISEWFAYDPSRILQLSEFVWSLRSSVWVVF